MHKEDEILKFIVKISRENLKIITIEVSDSFHLSAH